jgi:hypothetical protein
MENQRLNDYAAYQAAQRGDAACHQMQPDELLRDIQLQTIQLKTTAPAPQWWRDYTTGQTPQTPENPFFYQIIQFFQDGAHPADVIPHVFNFLHLTSLSHPDIALSLNQIPATRLTCAKGHTHTADHRCALIHIDQPDIDDPDQYAHKIAGLSAHCHQILRDAIDEGRLTPSTKTTPKNGEGGTDSADSPFFNENPQTVRLSNYLLAGGTSIRHIMRRAYFLAKGWFPDTLNGAALRVLADLSGETKQNWSGYALKLREELEATGIITDCAVKYAKTPTARANYEISAREGWLTRRKRQDDLRILN